MNVIVLGTNISNRQKMKKIHPILSSAPTIFKWSVDMEDVDKVLRVETATKVSENHIIGLLKSVGLTGRQLPDY